MLVFVAEIVCTELPDHASLLCVCFCIACNLISYSIFIRKVWHFQSLDLCWCLSVFIDWESKVCVLDILYS